MQDRIVRSLLSGHDLAAVMPTGGGKSLCYQLPVTVLGGTAVVISPLIALMQDQAAQLEQIGIPAAVLNSAVPGAEQSRIMRQAIAGAYKLLYLSPERLARENTVDWLSRVPVAYFAIDEAHCISEWGHEFRPEYRQLGAVRDAFPGKAIAAFTASATQQVRHDILRQLRLRDPHKYITSFHRPNLRYLVHRCERGTQRKLLISALRAYEGANAIVYAPTIKSVEETVAMLTANGIVATSYHGQMDNDERRGNQELWMSDEAPVMVGTLAFGLGINKPSVRAVVHLALPKSLEQYYQEAGRAGRDGKPADCLLLWQTKDAGLLAHFIEQIVDNREKQNAWARYRTIRQFAELDRCRHRQICEYFGETPKWTDCGGCDVCSGMPDWTREENRISPVPTPAPVRTRIAAEADPDLLAKLKRWRKEIAEERRVPAYVILHDSTLVEICREMPRDLSDLLQISGIGERKAAQYGDAVLAILKQR
jgi:ATP-dependent DNA helicase RecQ